MNVENSKELKKVRVFSAKSKDSLEKAVAYSILAAGYVLFNQPDLAKKYDAKVSRFPLDEGEEQSNCILCGRCVRYCAEVKKLDAVGFVGRGVNRKVELMPELGNECITCRECYGRDICECGRFVVLAEEFPFLQYAYRGR